MVIVAQLSWTFSYGTHSADLLARWNDKHGLVFVFSRVFSLRVGSSGANAWFRKRTMAAISNESRPRFSISIRRRKNMIKSFTRQWIITVEPMLGFSRTVLKLNWFHDRTDLSFKGKGQYWRSLGAVLHIKYVPNWCARGVTGLGREVFLFLSLR